MQESSTAKDKNFQKWCCISETQLSVYKASVNIYTAANRWIYKSPDYPSTYSVHVLSIPAEINSWTPKIFQMLHIEIKKQATWSSPVNSRADVTKITTQTELLPELSSNPKCLSHERYGRAVALLQLYLNYWLPNSAIH